MQYLLTIFFGSTLCLYASAYESTYTSILEHKCKTSEVFEMNMGTAQRCKGFANIEVEVIDDDLRMSLTLHRDKREYPLYFSQTITPFFSSLGDTLEWRYEKGKPHTPLAMIARLNAEIEVETDKDVPKFKKISYLAVSKITKEEVCVIAKIPPQKNQNILAREMADKAQKMPCLLKYEIVDTPQEPISMPFLDYKRLELLGAGGDQNSFYYFRDMGPLELSLRMLKMPDFSVWRIRLKLYPMFRSDQNKQLTGYKVIAERINLSDTKGTKLSDRHTLYFDMISSPALYDDYSTTFETFTTLNEPCGLQKSCTQKWEDSAGKWSKEENALLTKAPWETTLNPLASMVRTLAKKAKWLEKNGPLIEEWHTPEIPEGINENTPWVEVIIENQAGNGGGYLMEWHELVADDSIAKTLYRIYYDEASQTSKAVVQTAVLCGRRNNTTNPTQMCQ